MKAGSRPLGGESVKMKDEILRPLSGAEGGVGRESFEKEEVFDHASFLRA